MSGDFLMSVYSKVDDNSAYHNDLFDLFGSYDGSNAGYIGTKSGRGFRPIRWDWGTNGFMKVMKYVYFVELKRENPDRFDIWYNTEIDAGFPQTVETIREFLYVFKYRNHKIPAFISSLQSIEKKGNRLWLTFIPNKYFLLPLDFIVDFRKELFGSNGYENPEKWDRWIDIPRELIEEIFSSAATLDQYHIIPFQFVRLWIEQYLSRGGKPIFLTDVVDNRKRLSKNLATNNQIFWSIFSEYIERTQVRASVSMMFQGDSYLITDILVNSIIDDGRVYTQEAGVPKVICEAMKTVFENSYISKEFQYCREKNIHDSVFIKRAVKISSISGNYLEQFGNTDYDYVLDLTPLGIRKRIIFDLTCGLWHKGRDRTKQNHVEQWQHNVFEVPKQTDDVIAVWHCGLDARIEKYSGEEISKYLERKFSSTSKMIGPRVDIDTLNFVATKTFVLPFYKGEEGYFDFKREFHYLHPRNGDPKKTILYAFLRSLLGFLKKHS